MRATLLFGAGDVRVESIPDAWIVEPTDALVAVSRSCICGSDPWPYRAAEHIETGRCMGHEAIGVVEAIGSDIRTVERGDLVVVPFAYSDGTCEFCRKGLQTSCINGGYFGGTPRGRRRRPKRCVFPRRMARSHRCRSATMTRCCHRCSPCLT